MEFDDDVFVTPSTPDSWKEVADNFGKRLNFYHACGALDGKHMAIKKPKKSGSAYYSYKGFFSIAAFFSTSAFFVGSSVPQLFFVFRINIQLLLIFPGLLLISFLSLTSFALRFRHILIL